MYKKNNKNKNFIRLENPANLLIAILSLIIPSVLNMDSIISNNKSKYCPTCAKEIKLENDRKIQKERYYSNKFSQIENA
ncbi:hypothetical protein [Desulfosporosinus acidiphilus]|uniref:hypothetical protein n=1 Tax=Desulfosporosinus acidiphilus TaxID=885581 RepID=UPI001A9A4375|nr:hypothetical protein [Desulfosporosinus acidiphilus]